MSLPIVSVPPIISRLTNPYRGFFTKPQFKHFRRLVTGLIVSPNKTLQEINDAYGDTNQSSLNRFVSHSKWDLDRLNQRRLSHIRKCVHFTRKGILVIDESLLHKSGRHMELAGAHRSGMTKRIEWGHMAVNAVYTDTLGNTVPVDIRIYVKDKDCDKYGVGFKTKRELGIEEVDFALQAKLPISLVIADAGYQGEAFVRALQERLLDYIVGVRTTTKISIARSDRIEIKAYLDQLTKDDFTKYNTADQTYFYHCTDAYIRGIGKIKLVVSFTEDDEDTMKCYISNLDEDDATIFKLLLKRWSIECFHRDAKQHLGLEAYQVRLGRGMQVVALAILTAYTLVFLAMRKLKTPGRSLRTIGETCRYLGMIAYKGVRWIRRKMRDTAEFIHVLKAHVFVKNAKV